MGSTRASTGSPTSSRTRSEGGSPCAPPAPLGCARAPPGRPLPAPVGFCFLLASVAVGFFAFFGVPLVPLGSRVCVRGIRALYNAQGGRGRAPGGWDGGWGHHLGTALPGGTRDTPSPCMSLHPSPSCGPNVGAAGPWGGIWDYTPPPPSQHPLPAPCAPLGVPHVPSPPMSLRGRSPPRSVTPTEGGARGWQDPHGLPGHVPPLHPGLLPPHSPCQHSDCMSLPLTDGRTVSSPTPYCAPLPSTVFIPLVCAWCDVSLRLCPVQGRVFSAPHSPPPAPCA